MVSWWLGVGWQRELTAVQASHAAALAQAASQLRAVEESHAARLQALQGVQATAPVSPAADDVVSLQAALSAMQAQVRPRSPFMTGFARWQHALPCSSFFLCHVLCAICNVPCVMRADGATDGGASRGGGLSLDGTVGRRDIVSTAAAGPAERRGTRMTVNGRIWCPVAWCGWRLLSRPKC